MCESSNSEKYSRRESSFSNESTEEDEEKMEDAFTNLSAHVIAKLIEDEPDSYSIEDVKVRHKGRFTVIKASDLSMKAFHIAVEDKVSYYDSLFLAAAEREGIPLMTLDQKLQEKAKAKRDVRLVGITDEPPVCQKPALGKL